MRQLSGTTVVIGAQWGDEGKGKIVDSLAKRMDAVVRYGGGANAGHSLVIEGKKTVLHLLPSGIIRPQLLNLVGPYVVCDPQILLDEIKKLGYNGVFAFEYMPALPPAQSLKRTLDHMKGI